MAEKGAEYMRAYRMFSKTAKRFGMSVNDTARVSNGGATDAEARAIVKRVYGNKEGVTPAQKNLLYNRLTGKRVYGSDAWRGPYSS